MLLIITNVHATVSEILICSANSLAGNSHSVKTVPMDIVAIGGSTQL